MIKKKVQRALRRASMLSDRAFLGPHHLQLNPTSRCNHRCVMCWMTLEDRKKLAAKANDELGYEDYERLIDGLMPGVEEITLIGGGEPLVHRDAFRIMRHIKVRGYTGILHTNGSLIDKDRAAELVELGWDRINYSLHAADPDTYRRIHSVPAFDKVIEGLETIRDLKNSRGVPAPVVDLVFVILRDNFRSIPQMLELAERLEASLADFNYAIPYNPDVVVDEDEARELLDIVRPLLGRKTPFRHNLGAFVRKVESITSSSTNESGEETPYRMPGTKCIAGWYVVNVTSDGNVRPCCFSNEFMGNVREMSFSEIYNSDKYRKFRRELRAGKFREYCYRNRCSFGWIK